jgi:hypothetical protein
MAAPSPASSAAPSAAPSPLPAAVPSPALLPAPSPALLPAPWQAKPNCPAHLRNVIQRFVNDRDPAWRLPPALKGEVFASFDQCRERLNVFAMVEGFAVVIRGYGDSRNPSKRFQCIHHGKKTRNDGDLEHRVEKDSEGKIISKRQRDATHIKQKGCT